MSQNFPAIAPLIVIALASILAGCATTPTPLSAATSVPAERVLAFQQKNADDVATVVVTRDSGFLGGGCFYALWLNGTLSARFNPGESASFYLLPGEHLLKVGRDPMGQGLCALDPNEWTQRETIMKAKEVKRFRLSIDMNGKTDIQRTD